MTRIGAVVRRGGEWLEVVVRPRRFFRRTVQANDQAPAVYHIILLGAATAALRLSVGPTEMTGMGGSTVLGTLVWIVVTAIFIAPVGLHLAAAVATVMLMMTAPDRAGISMTVQVWAYAATPVVLTGVGSPPLTVAALALGAGLTVIGTAEVHALSPIRGLVATALPVGIVYGVGLGGFAAIARLLG